MALALVALLLPQVLQPHSPSDRLAQSTPRWVIKIEPSPTPGQASPIATQASPTAQDQAPAPAPTRVLKRATPTPPPRQDHYWLERPIAPGGVDTVARNYPYSSRMDGTYPLHHGVEFVNPLGTEILAPAEGVVVVAGDDTRQVYGARDDYYGLLVIIELERKLYSQPVYVLCGHLSEVKCVVGQRVAVGDVIGLVGMTGYAEGPHVHLEVRYGANDYGRTVNPELWLKPRPGFGTLAGLMLTAGDEPVPEARLVLYRADNPNTPVRYVTTYAERLVNADPAWGENFATGDLTPGDYVVQVYWRNQLYSTQVTVREGETAWVTLRT